MYPYPPDALILAPLSGYTDIPYRLSARRHGCCFAFTEMIDAGALVFDSGRTLEMLKRDQSEKWLGIQLIGSDPKVIEKSIKIVNTFDFNVIDFNLGCPVKKILKKGEGAALAGNPEKAADALKAITENTNKTVTAKIRIRHPVDPSPTIRLAESLVKAGAKAVCVHGRTVSQLYSGPVAYEIIARVRQELPVQIICNGGIKNRETYLAAIEKTGLCPVMLATGTMGNPWLFDEISQNKAFMAPSPEELAVEMEQHFAELIILYGIKTGVRLSRKIFLDYLSGRGYGGETKKTASLIANEEDAKMIFSKVRDGPSPRYWKWLENNSSAPKRLRNSQI